MICRVTCARWTLLLTYKAQFNKAEEAKGKNREATNQNEHRKKAKTDLQTYTRQHSNFAHKKINVSKKKKGTTQNARQELH